jgi:hypothetical protein
VTTGPLVSTPVDVDVYLDVDGVLNAVWAGSTVPDWGWVEGSLRTERILGFPITWSALLIDRLNALAERPHVHFHWLTTWFYDAPNVLCDRIGLRGQDWPVLGAEDFHSPRAVTDWWKLPPARAAAEGSGRRVLWIDDDLLDRGALEWAMTLGDRIMLVLPSTGVGITKDMMSTIEEWVG